MNITKKPRPDRRNRINNPDYNTRKWQKKRLSILSRDGYLCQCDDCKKLPVPLPAPIKRGVVDHIKQVSRGGSFWDDENLQAMNESCHAKKSQSEKR